MEVLQRTANRGSVSTGYDIDNSVKLEADNSEYFSRTPSSNTNRQTFTYSTWVKRTELGINGAILDAYQDGANFFLLQFDTSDRFVAYQIDSGTDYGYHYTRRFRDTSAWYHIVFVSDTTNGTASDRYQLYVNGERISNSDVDTDYGTPPQNYNNNLNSTILHSIGKRGDGAIYNSCYLAETHLVDGTALAPTAFGEFDEDSGIWKPIEVDVTYGTNGFYLNYITASNMGNDKSGENNDFAENNIAAADHSTDTPTNNFCTLNPILTNAGSANYLTMTEGATKSVNAGNAYRLAVGSIGVTSGKWYWEVKATSVGATMYMGITYPSVWDADYTLGGTIFLDDNNDPVRYNASGRSSFGSAFGNGDIIAFALDMDASTPTMTVYKNNSSLGDLMSGLSIGGTGTAYLPPKEDGYFPKVGGYGAMTFECNFGGYTSGTPSSAASDANGYGTFEYAPPSGYYALCTKNLAEYG